MLAIDLLIMTCAVARLSRFLVHEHGPFDIAGWVRFVFDADAPNIQPGTLGELMNCTWCLSFWIALAIMVPYLWFSDETVMCCVPFAVSFVAGFLVKLSL